MEEWDGFTERRAADGSRVSSLAGIEAAIHRLSRNLEDHIKEEQDMKPHLIELVDILQKSKGAILLLKILVAIGGSAWVFIIWLKDHFKW